MSTCEAVVKQTQMLNPEQRDREKDWAGELDATGA